MTALELSKRYYPKYWSKERIAALVRAGKLTPAEYEQITGEPYGAAK